MKDKPYEDFMFLGITPFAEQLKTAGTEFKIIQDENFDKLFTEDGAILNKETDTITKGFASRGEKEYYFIEFGLKLTEHVITYIVFLYNSDPSIDDIRKTSKDIESLANEYLEGVKNQNVKQSDFPTQLN